ncbi:BTAD domain-containing putative transcriptional regulator [Streptomyces sp. PA03-3a]|nr:BTAD domain-containing putative transcriptional regulator [Streptomyces sp. PA03-3a]
MQIRFAVLGTVRAWSPDGELPLGGAKQKAVLAALLLARGKPVSMERIISAVWGEEAPSAAGTSVRSYVYRLRRVFAPYCPNIVSIPGGYLLSAVREVDTWRFEELNAQAVAARDTADTAAELRLLEQALEVGAGEALVGVPGPFAQQQRELHRELLLAATERRMTCLLALGHAGQAAAELASLVIHHPLHEGMHELLMLALHQSGRQARSLEVYVQLQDRLRSELGLDPTPRLKALHLRVLRNEESLPPGMGARSRGESPEQETASIRPMQLPAPTYTFVGRSTMLERLDATVGPAPSQPIVGLLVGVPGVGKTALALRWAHRMIGSFPDGQLYADFRGSLGRDGEARSVQSVLNDFLMALGVGPDRLPPTQDAAASLYRSLLAGRRILVVLDDMAASHQVTDLIPGTPGSSALITSQTRLPQVETAYQIQPLYVRPFTDAEAREFLVRHLGVRRVENDLPATRAILELCGGIPLNLTVAIYLSHDDSGPSLRSVAARLRASRFGRAQDRALSPDRLFETSFTSPSRRVRQPLVRVSNPGDESSTAGSAAPSAADRPVAEASGPLTEPAERHFVREETCGEAGFSGN